YKIDFQVTAETGGGGVWGISVGGATNQARTFVNRSDNTQTIGSLIIEVVGAPTIVELVNLSGESVTLTNGLADNLGTSVSASMTIMKLS
ncbi:MAG: hypothetical protein ACOCWI_04630, partial [Bacillota bacterium]